MQEARRIPEVGQIFTFHGFRFEILRRKRNQVTGLRVTPPTAAAPLVRPGRGRILRLSPSGALPAPGPAAI